MGRILGIDYGTKRVGAALSDPGQSIASPLEVYERVNHDRDAVHYHKLVEDEEIDRIVVGLPLHTSGAEGHLAGLSRTFGAWLAKVTGRPVFFHDERYTSVDAEDLLLEHGVKRKGRKARRDMLAAQILLQNYLDAGCPVTEPAPQPIEDSPEARPSQ